MPVDNLRASPFLINYIQHRVIYFQINKKTNHIEIDLF